MLVVSRYYLGLPFYRLQGYQAMLGVPVPDSTQWDQIEKVGDCCYVVFDYLEFLAAQGELIHQDDTSVRIVTLIQENQAIHAQAAAQGLSRPKERTGMFTTALVVKVGERTICLYYSGRSHAGENLEALLKLFKNVKCGWCGRPWQGASEEDSLSSGFTIDTDEFIRKCGGPRSTEGRRGGLPPAQGGDPHCGVY